MYEAGSKLPDVYLKIDKLVSKHGYPVEEYKVHTEDGYILGLFRIRGSGQAVLLVHGMFLSADDFVTAGPESGFAYLFAEEGFDVWLGNARGTKHSLAHISLPPHSAAFWDFSWDEIGRYDLPAMIDFVLTTTNQSQLLFIGHSQGATAFFVMASERPEYNDKVSLMVALGPAAASPNLKSPLIQIAHYATLLHADILPAVLRKNGLIKIASTNVLTKAFSYAACVESRIARSICNNIVFVMCGVNKIQLNFTSLPSVLFHQTSAVALKQLEHYAQTMTYQRFTRFDYGADINKVIYGSRVPPEYNLSGISTPITIFYSVDDWFASEIDIYILRKKLKNVVDFHKIPDKKFTHLDFVYAKDVRKFIFIPILNQIKKLT